GGGSTGSRRGSLVPAVGHEFDDRLGRAFDRRLVARLWHAARPHRSLIAASLVLFPLISAVELAQPYLMKVAIDNHILKADWLGLTWIVALYVGVLVLLYALHWLEAYLMNLTGQRVIHDLRAALFGHLLRLVAAGYFRLRARDAYRRVRQRLAHLNGLLQESLQGMAVIQLFARERYEAERFREANGAYHRAVFASTSYDFFLYASVEALGSIAVAVLLWYGGGEIIAGAVSFGVLVAFIQYTHRFFLPIRDL